MSFSGFLIDSALPPALKGKQAEFKAESVEIDRRHLRKTIYHQRWLRPTTSEHHCLNPKSNCKGIPVGGSDIAFIAVHGGRLKTFEAAKVKKEMTKWQLIMS